MDDLISRQAAIDAFWHIRCNLQMMDDTQTADKMMHGLRLAENAVEQLPSANQWIPCSERLPEDGTWNIFTDGKRISIERYKFDIISHFWPEPRWFDLEDAVAWMPLPEPWKGEENA